jgi:ketosteroid isomerase-like protein
MSQQNVEVVRRAFESFNRTGEFDLSVVDPEVVFDNSNAMLDAAEYRGHEGMREYLSLLRGMWQRQRIEPLELIPVGDDRVIVPMKMVMVGRDEIETVAHAANLFTVREGRITHVKAFQGKADALEAVGLGE